MDPSVLYAPQYAIWGVDADVTPKVADPLTLRVIDKTKGAALQFHGHEAHEGRQVHASVGTLHAAFDMLASDLAAAGLLPEDLINGLIAFNGKTWEIKNVFPTAGPNGEAGGELRFSLIAHDEASA